jgi:hypothetical protein
MAEAYSLFYPTVILASAQFVAKSTEAPADRLSHTAIHASLAGARSSGGALRLGKAGLWQGLREESYHEFDRFGTSDFRVVRESTWDK